jgi:hypothetical protein
MFYQHDTVSEEDTMIITIGVQQRQTIRDRRISSECEEMLRELYSEITLNCHECDGKGESGCDRDCDDEYEFNGKNSISNLSCYTVDTSDEISIKHAIKMDYEWNYTMPILIHICGFYGLKKRGTKRELIDIIVDYELKPENEETVKYRKQIFEFMRLIKENEYMKRFIMFP